MTGKCPEFEFGVKFPTPKQSSSSSSKSTSPSSRSTKLPPIPEGSSQRYIMSERVMNGRVQTLHTYQCPSRECDFIVKNSLNKDAASKTLDTHLRTDHRKKSAA